MYKYEILFFHLPSHQITALVFPIINWTICCPLVLYYALNVVFDVQKKLYNLPELGGGGGRGNLGNARKKLIFLMGGVP